MGRVGKNNIRSKDDVWTVVLSESPWTANRRSPQRQVLYSASKGVNSSVGLCFFFVATYRNDLISVGGHKKNTDLQKKWNISVFYSHSVLPTKMTYGNLFVFFGVP